ncbi:MAG: hypothetical protein R3A10_19910 [Caldilineaceae bacterium]
MRAGATGDVPALEVAAQLDNRTVRIGADSHPRSGPGVRPWNRPVRRWKPPVGEALLGRMFNVLEANHRQRRRRPQDCAWRPIHQAPVPLAQQAWPGRSVTGIKAIDLRRAAGTGRQGRSSAAAPGWARPCSSTELIHNMVSLAKA